ncbi:hypothetical protein DICPUDRAFT_93277 [Dictyostelium purpureum]|uniref:Uncharacterized protein n=1 Tax=Dictyostelium purpureum TaxID=5786 RepID=F1A4Z7_DICPU|nr:uncharacterized protein DICPUDRAFT_93277 [Dictyostelium purpureum]EGC28732.1 hypothetical protein DICPUDRAFT_93277 [Dictyostelium purpureum]|eukprot:XP_003294741.1 hypothetical protein DICPUDRAFT_93277 [Dictyostelium purpureum]
MNTQDFNFKWDINHIIDKTRFSEENEKPIQLSNNDLTASRHERAQGDDYPPVRIFSNNFISLDYLMKNHFAQWSIHIDSTHGFIEVGIIEPSSQSTFFIKGFKNEAQHETAKDIKTFEFGETYTTGDTIKIKLELNPTTSTSQSKTISLYLFKNDKSLGLPFKDIQIDENTKLYPMAGLNDDGDKISIVR